MGCVSLSLAHLSKTTLSSAAQQTILLWIVMYIPEPAQLRPIMPKTVPRKSHATMRRMEVSIPKLSLVVGPAAVLLLLLFFLPLPPPPLVDFPPLL